MLHIGGVRRAALWFLFNSFASPLPWADTPNMTAANQTGRGALDFWEVATLHCRGELSSCSWLNVTDWAAVAESQPSLFETDGLVMPLVACLVLGWFLIWLCVCKGIESLGKVRRADAREHDTHAAVLAQHRLCTGCAAPPTPHRLRRSLHLLCPSTHSPHLL